MNLLDPRLWLALIGALAISFVSGYLTKGRQVKDAAAKAQIAQVKADVKKHNEVTNQLEVKRDERSATYRKITSDARRVAATAGDGGCFNADRLRAANEAIQGRVAAKSDKALPAATTIN